MIKLKDLLKEVNPVSPVLPKVDDEQLTDKETKQLNSFLHTRVQYSDTSLDSLARLAKDYAANWNQVKKNYKDFQAYLDDIIEKEAYLTPKPLK